MSSSCIPVMTDHICRNIDVKLQTGFPVTRTPASFQWPKRTFWLMYSSAMLKPPVKAVRPSTTRIFLWSRLFMTIEAMKRSGLKQAHLMPSACRVL